ncbi:hypothetical protein LTR09_010662 [Extremus antarcticus]|uniref:Uncharacterized protein n=1 Tax=Extremus antarcticus TaxID=702011 RepID=A0AAJ0G8G5_9PEZI|nr:hypothetical protein LTR09_010662 [Extremus antarcticus]
MEKTSIESKTDLAFKYPDDRPPHPSDEEPRFIVGLIGTSMLRIPFYIAAVVGAQLLHCEEVKGCLATPAQLSGKAGILTYGLAEAGTGITWHLLVRW